MVCQKKRNMYLLILFDNMIRAERLFFCAFIKQLLRITSDKRKEQI